MSTRINQAIWLEQQNRWQIKVQADGIRKTFTCSTPGRVGKAECHKKADEWLEKRLVDERTKVEILFDRWIEKLEENSTGSTGYAKQYKSYGKCWIKPRLGQKAIGRVVEQDLQDVIDAMHKVCLAKKTQLNVRNCITAFIKYCRKCRATTLRPENLTIHKSAPAAKRTILQPEDLRTLFSSDKTTYRGRVITDRLVHMYRFAILTGLRPGELVALESAHLTPVGFEIAGAINYEGEETSGKNENALRKRRLSKLAKIELEKQKAMLKREGIISKFVFPGLNGKSIRQETFARAWERYTKHNGLARVTPYEMRHTYVSINKKMPAALKKLAVGHSQDMDTDGTYSHEMDGDLAEIAKLEDAAFNKILRSEKNKSTLKNHKIAIPKNPPKNPLETF